MTTQKISVREKPAQMMQYARQQVRSRRRTIELQSSAESRQLTLIIVRWGLAAMSLGLLASGDAGTESWSLGLSVIAVLSTSNLVLARLRPETVDGVGLSVAIGLLDAVLVVVAWYASGYESFTPIILSLCLLNLALVGVSLAEIGAVALAAIIIYSVIGQVD
jgi:hypothetical protein